MRNACIGCFIVAMATVGVLPVAASAEDVVITVLKDAAIQWSKDAPDVEERDGLAVFDQGQIVQRSVELPAAPKNQRDARRITARLIVEPVPVEKDGKITAGDPWTRLGCVSLNLPGEAGKKSKNDGPAKTPPRQVELMRFITGFGGRAEYTADLTPYAPMLQNEVTLQVFISTYASPAWKVTFTLTYSSDGVGQRRPEWASPLFCEESMTASKNKVRATITVPKGLEQPRVLITSTGHATDGAGGDEFVTRTHILRIDGVEVARWRPWAEGGGTLRGANPASGRDAIDGRERWVSDLDRSGWHPGMIVEPMRIPVPELTPGKHTIELEIVGIRAPDPADSKGDHGYWRACAVAVADQPWPDEGDDGE